MKNVIGLIEMNEYPIFKNGTVYVDHTLLVTQEMAEVWKRNGFKKIKTLSSGTDHIKQNSLPVENWDGTIEPTIQWCIKKLFDWAYWPKTPIEIAKRKVFIIGQAGRIGKRLTDILMEITGYIYTDGIDLVYLRDEEPGTLEEILKEKIPEQDIIFLCINPEWNTNFWDKEKLGWMKKNAVLITPSRPSVLSPEALKDMRIIWDVKHEAWRTDACLKRKKEAVQ